MLCLCCLWKNTYFSSSDSRGWPIPAGHSWFSWVRAKPSSRRAWSICTWQGGTDCQLKETWALESGPLKSRCFKGGLCKEGMPFGWGKVSERLICNFQKEISLSQQKLLKDFKREYVLCPTKLQHWLVNLARQLQRFIAHFQVRAWYRSLALTSYDEAGTWQGKTQHDTRGIVLLHGLGVLWLKLFASLISTQVIALRMYNQHWQLWSLRLELDHGWQDCGSWIADSWVFRWVGTGTIIGIWNLQASTVLRLCFNGYHVPKEQKERTCIYMAFMAHVSWRRSVSWPPLNPNEATLRWGDSQLGFLAVWLGQAGSRFG